MRDAQSALDQLIAFRGRNLSEDDVLSVFGLVSQAHIEHISAAILGHDIPALLTAIGEFDRTGRDLERVLLDLLEHMRNVLVQAYSPGNTLLADLPDSQAEVIREQAAAVEPSRVSQLIEQLIEAEGRLKYSLSKRTLLETSLIRAARAAHHATLDEVLQQIERMKQGLPEIPPGEKKK
jgi:DNA polymerase III subunit gamma/tau